MKSKKEERKVGMSTLGGMKSVVADKFSLIESNDTAMAIMFS
jgi:hypothetical protein